MSEHCNHCKGHTSTCKYCGCCQQCCDPTCKAFLRHGGDLLGKQGQLLWRYQNGVVSIHRQVQFVTVLVEEIDVSVLQSWIEDQEDAETEAHIKRLRKLDEMED